MLNNEKDNILTIIKENHEINMEEKRIKFVKNSIDQVEKILSRYNCIFINKEHAKSCMHTTIGYDFSLVNQYQDVEFIFNLFRPNILFDKKDCYDEMKKRGYKNLTIDFINFCIQFDVDYIYAGDIYKIVDRSENDEITPNDKGIQVDINIIEE